MGDGSFPHPIPELDADTEADPAEPTGGRVLDFPSEDSGGEGPTGVWSGGENTTVDPAHLQPAAFDREPGGELVVFPRSSTEKRRRPADASGTQKTQAPSSVRPPEPEPEPAAEPEPALVAEPKPSPAEPKPSPGAEPGPDERPAYLASELLREDLTPAEPLRRTLRFGGLMLGGLGATIMIGLGGIATIPLVFAGIFGLVAIVGLLPIAARGRGVALAVLGTTGAGLAGYLVAVEGDAPSHPLLVACIILAASGLFFRAAHRESRFARVIAAIGLLTMLFWLTLSGGVDALVVEGLEWQTWLSPAAHFLLIAVGLGAVLTFLDPRGHGGAWIAGWALLVWVTLHTAALVAVAMFPTRSVPSLEALSDPRWLSVCALPLLAALAAGGLCQVWALVGRRAARSAEPQ